MRFFLFIFFVPIVSYGQLKIYQFDENGFDSVYKKWNMPVHEIHYFWNSQDNAQNVTHMNFLIENKTVYKVKEVSLEICAKEKGKSYYQMKERWRVVFPYAINPGDVVETLKFELAVPKPKAKMDKLECSASVMFIYTD